MILIIAAMCLLAATSNQDALNVQVSVKEGTYFVGQGVEIRVGVVGLDQRPRIVVPRLPDIAPELVREEFRQLTSSGIGSKVMEQNLYITRYRIVPRVAGTLRIPPFRASLEGRSGASQPLVITVKPLPPGRPAGFLGGVGRIDLKAEVSPSAVRAGQEFEYRLTLSGPGARGSIETPELELMGGRDRPFRVEALPTETKADPPTRIFRYRVRAEVAGDFRIPPATVAWLDPATTRYFSVKSESVSIRVADVPEFDASEFGPPAPVSKSKRGDQSLHALVAGLSTAGLIAGWLLVRGIWSARTGSRKNLQMRIHEIQEAPADALASTISAFLSDVATGTQKRVVGEMTPQEIQDGLRFRGWSNELADRAAGLARDCERARFSGLDFDPGRLREAAMVLASELQSAGRLMWGRSRRPRS